MRDHPQTASDGVLDGPTRLHPRVDRPESTRNRRGEHAATRTDHDHPRTTPEHQAAASARAPTRVQHTRICRFTDTMTVTDRTPLQAPGLDGTVTARNTSASADHESESA